MAKNPFDKYNKRLKRAGELRYYMKDALEDAGFTLTKSGYLSLKTLKDKSEEQVQALFDKLEDTAVNLIPKSSAELTYKYTSSLFEELLLDYYEFDTEDGVVLDTNVGRTGQLNSRVTKLSREQQNELTKILRGERDPKTGKWSGGLGSAFRNKSKGYDARTIGALQTFRGYFGRRT